MSEINVSTRGMRLKFDELQKRIKEVLSDDKVMSEVSSTLEKDMKFQARKGVDPEGRPYKPLSDRWVEKRKQIKDSKHGAYSPGRSNLTITGQLIDALRIAAESSSVSNTRRFLYTFLGDHTGYTFKNGKTTNSIPNEILAEYVQDQGRQIIGVRESLIPRIKRILVAAIRRAPEAFK
jgi:hypothetical protein